MKSNSGILTGKEIQKKEPSFGTKSNSVPEARKNLKELERTSTDMQKLLVALKEFSMGEIKAIRKLDGYSFRVHGKNDPKYIVWSAYQRDLDYAISIAPKTFKIKQG